MKVKVSYTIDYEKVPKLIDKILSECSEKLRRHSKLEFGIRQLDQFAMEVRQAQEDLSLVHDQFEDCINLATGFLGVLNEQAPAELQRTPAEEIKKNHGEEQNESSQEG